MEHDQESQELGELRPEPNLQLGGLCVITIIEDQYSCERYDAVVARVLQRQGERPNGRSKSQSQNALYMGSHIGKVSSAVYTESVYDTERKLAEAFRSKTETVQKVSAFVHAAKIVENLIELGWEPDEGRIRRLCEVVKREHESYESEEADRDEDRDSEDF